MLEKAEERAVKDAEKFLDEIIAKKAGGEDRPQQREMVRAVAHAITNDEHLIVQAGTGVGKTLGYLIPLAVDNRRAIISTATNQLSQQIYDIDLPFVSKLHEEVYGHSIDYAIVKGRANYLCKAKLDQLNSLDKDNPASKGFDTDLFEDAGERSPIASFVERERSKVDEYQDIYAWADQTETGDRVEAPSVSDETWRGVSSTSAECPGKSTCPFGQECFAELARERGRDADIVVTNHALVGADLDSEGSKVLGDREILVMDEMHEMDSYLTSAWGTELTVKNIKDAINAARKAAPANETDIRNKVDEMEEVATALELYLEDIEEQRFVSGLPESLRNALERLRSQATHICVGLASLEHHAERRMKTRLRIGSQMMGDLIESITMLMDDSGDMVRWVSPVRTKRGTQGTLFAAPLRIGPKFMRLLDENQMTLVATSATITVGGKFDIPMRNLAMDEPITMLDSGTTKPPRPHSAIDVGTPFNYKKQGIIYVPKPAEFAAPVGKERFEHMAAVKEFAAEAVAASKGRALVLSTTTRGAQEIGEHLRGLLSTPVLVQGDMPAGRIVDEFVESIDSTLVGTMGFWHGLNAPGETCSLVIIDKIPFSPMDDPLLTARQEDVVSRGGNGFMDVYVAGANVMLAQGVGRLIRHTSDRGVVAILDTRLATKAYGTTMLKSLPQMYATSNRQLVMKSLQNLVS